MLSPTDRTRLIALLGMLGSEHSGERDNAAVLIEKFRKERNLTWDDLVLGVDSGITQTQRQEAFMRGYAKAMGSR